MDLDISHLQSVLQAITLHSRPLSRRRLWLKRGIPKLQRNSARIMEYWKRRLNRGDLRDLHLYRHFVIKAREIDPLPDLPPLPTPEPSALPPEPSVSTMAATFGKSMVNWAMNGFKTVTEEQLKTRMDVCRSCPLWDPGAFAHTGRCLKCGCSTQAKLRLAHEKCPEGKWGPLTPE